MEGLALLAALDDANGAECEITTDSEFWINVLTKWAPTWARNGWQKKGGIKNLDIVQPLFELFQNSRASLIWTRGHVGTELNELADEWANRARRLKVVGVKKVKEL
jgi:ribonuclease HI